MIIEHLTWTDLKEFAMDRGQSLQYFDKNDAYNIYCIDGQLAGKTAIHKSLPAHAIDKEDFETNYKANANIRLTALRDSDGAIIQKIKVTTSGWNFQLHGIEFTTCKLDSVVSTNDQGVPWNFTTHKVYKANGDECTTQLSADASGVKTVVDWEPNFDYEIVGGMIKLKALISTDVRLWVIGVPDIPAQYGGSKIFASNLNLDFITLEEGVRVDGRAPKLLSYSPTLHTNKLRIVFTHGVGVKADIHMMFEIFKA